MKRKGGCFQLPLLGCEIKLAKNFTRMPSGSMAIFSKKFDLK